LPLDAAPTALSRDDTAATVTDDAFVASTTTTDVGPRALDCTAIVLFHTTIDDAVIDIARITRKSCAAPPVALTAAVMLTTRTCTPDMRPSEETTRMLVIPATTQSTRNSSSALPPPAAAASMVQSTLLTTHQRMTRSVDPFAKAVRRRIGAGVPVPPIADMFARASSHGIV
jgi:hypothetical protein